MNDMHKVLVIGGSGFLGHHLIERLLELGMSVRNLDCKNSSIEDNQLEFFEGDFTDVNLVDEIMDDCDVVYHLASTTIPKTSNEDPLFDIQTNLIGTVALLNLAVKKQIKKFVFISSGGTVYGIPEQLPVPEDHSTNPMCAYGITKLSIEKYLCMYQEMYNLKTCSLRLSNPYGEFQRVDTGQGAVTTFCHKAVNGDTIEIWGDGNVVRDFIYVKDAIEAMIKAMDIDCFGRPINIGSGYGVSLNELILEIKKANKGIANIVYKPERIFDVPKIYLDISRAKNMLNWEPKVSLSEGICQTISSMRQLAYVSKNGNVISIPNNEKLTL